MINLEIGKKKYKIPQNWDEISIGKFQEMMNIPDDLVKKEYFLKVVCVLGSIPYDEFKQVPYYEFTKLEDELTFVFDKLPEEIKTEWTFDGKTYKYYSDFSKITTGEYIDLDGMSKDTENLHLLLAIAYRETDEYNSDEVGERAKIFKEHMPVSVAIAAKIFFSLNEIVYSRNILGYSDKTPVKS